MCSDRQKLEISVMVDEVNAAERALQLPEIEGLQDYDRLEAMDILNRIERRMLANMPTEQAAE